MIRVYLRCQRIVLFWANYPLIFKTTFCSRFSSMKSPGISIDGLLALLWRAEASEAQERGNVPRNTKLKLTALRTTPMLWFAEALLILTAVQLFSVPAFAFHLDPAIESEPPFVICHNQQYALCAEGSCFVYNGVAYCECDIMNGDSVSLQLSYSSSAGERNVCDVNRQGKTNGYMVSTFSFP